MTRRVKYVLPALLLIFSCTNNRNKPVTYTEEIIGNIKHIHNLQPLWTGKDERISLELVLKYGEFESDNEDLMLHRPADVAVDGNGKLFIADQGNYQIKKFDRQGNLLLSFGQKGQGPRDFLSLNSLFINDKNELFVMDINRTKVFDTNGRYLRVLDINHEFGYFPLAQGKYIKSGMVSLGNPDQWDKMSSDFQKRPLVRIYDELGHVVCRYGQSIQSTSNRPKQSIEEKYYDFLDLLILSSYSTAVGRQDHYYLTFDARNRIEKYGSDGRLIFRASRALSFEESTEVRKVDNRNKLGEAAFVPMYNRFSQSIHVDWKNRLWIPTHVRQYTREERLHDYNTLVEPGLVALEVYDDQGILLQRIPWEFGSARQLKHIENDRLFFTSWTDECVYEYRSMTIKRDSTK
jgi:hypothetical protein